MLGTKICRMFILGMALASAEIIDEKNFNKKVQLMPADQAVNSNHSIKIYTSNTLDSHESHQTLASPVILPVSIKKDETKK